MHWKYSSFRQAGPSRSELGRLKRVDWKDGTNCHWDCLILKRNQAIHYSLINNSIIINRSALAKMKPIEIWSFHNTSLLCLSACNSTSESEISLFFSVTHDANLGLLGRSPVFDPSNQPTFLQTWTFLALHITSFDALDVRTGCLSTRLLCMLPRGPDQASIWHELGVRKGCSTEFPYFRWLMKNKFSGLHLLFQICVRQMFNQHCLYAKNLDQDIPNWKTLSQKVLVRYRTLTPISFTLQTGKKCRNISYLQGFLLLW